MTDRGRRPTGRDPVPIADSLAEVGAELGLPDPEVLGTLAQHWADVVGADAAVHTTPRTIRDGELRVVVDDPGWATQLRYLSETLLDRVDAIVGAGVVRRVRVTVTPGRR